MMRSLLPSRSPETIAPAPPLLATLSRRSRYSLASSRGAGIASTAGPACFRPNGAREAGGRRSLSGLCEARLGLPRDRLATLRT